MNYISTKETVDNKEYTASIIFTRIEDKNKYIRHSEELKTYRINKLKANKEKWYTTK